jgi:hypothetical protein
VAGAIHLEQFNITNDVKVIKSGWSGKCDMAAPKRAFEKNELEIKYRMKIIPWDGRFVFVWSPFLIIC